MKAVQLVKRKSTTVYSELDSMYTWTAVYTAVQRSYLQQLTHVSSNLKGSQYTIIKGSHMNSSLTQIKSAVWKHVAAS